MFSVEIWGTVGQWVAAVGTSSAALAAATYYIRDKQIDNRAQAESVIYRKLAQQPTGERYEVVNLSDNTIFDIGFQFHLPRFTDSIKRMKDYAFVGYTPLSSLYDDWKRLPVEAFVEADIDKLGGGNSYKMDFTPVRTALDLHPVMGFRDHRGKRWYLTIDGELSQRFKEKAARPEVNRIWFAWFKWRGRRSLKIVKQDARAMLYDFMRTRKNWPDPHDPDRPRDY